MSLRVLTLNNNEQWDNIVRSFKRYDVYWLSGYVKAFYIHGDGEPLLFYYEKGGSRGINVVMKRDVSSDPIFKDKLEMGEYYDFVTPYGYGGWIIEGKETEELFEEYRKWALRNNIVSEFVRFHPMLNNNKECEQFYNVMRLGRVVDMDISSPEVIWSNITSKNRNVIRKAMKNDVHIYNGRYPEIFNKFIDIYNETMERDNAEDYYYFEEAFYESIMNDLSYNAQIFYAVKDEKVIAASIMLEANGKINYHLSGSLSEYRNLAPTNLLLYETALWGCLNGYKTLYLGGGVGSGNDNLYKFKESFNRNADRHFYIGKKVLDEDKYNKLLSMRGNIETSFFPEYRGK